MTATQIALTAPVIEVEDTPISAAISSALLSLEIDRAVNLIGRATLRFVEDAFNVNALPVFTIGSAVTIKVADGTTLFTGTVTGFSLDQELEGPAGTTATITVDDDGHRLTRNSSHQAFLKQSYSDVLKSVISSAGLSASVVSLTEIQDYILQSGTPMSFLNWVCNRFGLLWWVEGRTVHVVTAGTSSGTVRLTAGETLLRLSTRASDRHPSKVTVTGWDHKQQVQVTNTAASTSRSESELVGKVTGRTKSPGTGISIPALALTPDEAKAVSSSLQGRAVAAAVTTRGTTVIAPALKPGTTVDITRAGPASGSYFVSRVLHVYNDSGFYTRFTAGPLEPESIVDLLGRTPPTGGALSGTLLTAVVTNNKDSANLGRVKVQLPMLGDGVDSQWARVVTLGGGPNRGVVFQPEVNDEVLVGFENGDTRRPVVLGGLYSERNSLPSTDNVSDGKVKYRRITSRLGHLIELYDGAGPAEQYVQLKTKGGHYVKVGEDKLELKVANKPVSITNGPAKVEFTDKGDITIEGVNVTIKASNAVKIEGGTGASLKSSASTKVEGTTVDVNAKASGNIKADGPLSIKGATVAIN